MILIASQQLVAMSQPHVIRLRGPWQYEPLVGWALDAQGARCEAAELPPPGRMVMPGDWGAAVGGAFRGRVRFVRPFGRPTGLEPGQRVWLAVGGVDLSGRAQLNGQLLGPLAGFREPTRFDVTDRLDERNELVIDVELPPLTLADEQRLRCERAGLPGGLIGEVRLEIFPAS